MRRAAEDSVAELFVEGEPRSVSSSRPEVGLVERDEEGDMGRLGQYRHPVHEARPERREGRGGDADDDVDVGRYRLLRPALLVVAPEDVAPRL